MESRFIRLKDESLEKYNYRVCRQKDLNVYDLTWDGVRDILNKENDVVYGSSKWRKDYQVVQKYLDGLGETLELDQHVLDEMKQARLEIEMERKKKQTDSIYYNRILREHSREEMLKEKVVDAIANADKIPLPEFLPLQKNENGKSEYLLGVSDVHAYKKFVSLTNEYSKEILEDRMANLLLEIKQIVIEQKIEEITVVNGGDSLEGLLRVSALGMLELGVIDTVVEFRRFMASWLKELSTFVKVKYIHLISANHSETRPLNTRAGQMPSEDFEKDIANYIHDILEDNKRIDVILPDLAFYEWSMAGYEIIAHHGHGISSSPEKFIDKMTRKRRKFYDYGIFGHLHTEMIKPIDEGPTNDCEILRLPSIVGSCTFADSILKGSKASAVMFRFTENKGRDREFKFILN